MIDDEVSQLDLNPASVLWMGGGGVFRLCCLDLLTTISFVLKKIIYMHCFEARVVVIVVAPRMSAAVDTNDK